MRKMIRKIPSFVLPLLVLIVFALVPPAHATSACSQVGVFMVLTDSGTWYALIGIDPAKISGANASTQISVSGTWGGLPVYSNFIHPDYRFKGNIYVTQYVFKNASYTGTGLGQIPASGEVVSIVGTLAWSNGACVQALQQSANPIVEAWNALVAWLSSLFSWSWW